jgi:hypothetical protein
MTFMIMDANIYDPLFGLNLLIKIKVVMYVEKGAIQVRQWLKNNFQLLTLNNSQHDVGC